MGPSMPFTTQGPPCVLVGRGGAESGVTREIPLCNVSPRLNDRHCTMKRVLLILSLFCSIQAARPPKKANDPPLPPEQSTSQFAAEASHDITFSVTWSPAITAAGQAVPDEDQMGAVVAFLQVLDIEMAIRHADATIVHCIFTRERGEREGHAHIQGHFTLRTTATSNAERRALLNAEKQWLKALEQSSDLPVRGRLVLKTVKPKDLAYATHPHTQCTRPSVHMPRTQRSNTRPARLALRLCHRYAIGYDQKDKGQAHYLQVVHGLRRR